MSRRLAQVVLVLALVAPLAACSERAAPTPSPAPTPPPAAAPPPEQFAPMQEPPSNPYVPQIQERRRVWQARRYTDYVFVLDEHVFFASPARTQLRVVVRNGRVAAARSLIYGGSARLEKVPTMDELFDRAEQYASQGNNGVPASFTAEYDDRNGSLRKVVADGRLTIADDEASFYVSCFSEQPDGCSAVLLSKAQCRSAGGWLAPANGDGCERNGWSIGLVSQTEQCCRTFSRGDHDEITAAQCKAANGREDDCSDFDLYVGSSQSRSTSCCRRFYR